MARKDQLVVGAGEDCIVCSVGSRRRVARVVERVWRSHHAGGQSCQTTRQVRERVTDDLLRTICRFDMIAQAFEYEQKQGQFFRGFFEITFFPVSNLRIIGIDLQQFFDSTTKCFSTEPFLSWDRDLRARRKEYLLQKKDWNRWDFVGYVDLSCWLLGLVYEISANLSSLESPPWSSCSSPLLLYVSRHAACACDHSLNRIRDSRIEECQGNPEEECIVAAGISAVFLFLLFCPCVCMFCVVPHLCLGYLAVRAWK